MDIGDLRGISTIFCMVAFAAVVYWAYGPSRKGDFEEAGMLPFSNKESNKESGEESDGESVRQSNSRESSKGYVNVSAEDFDERSHEQLGGDFDTKRQGGEVK
jgi:cytochrome c oxidase cbb3-type subunit 4